MGLSTDHLWPAVSTYRRRRLPLLERVFLGAFTFGLLLGAFGATAVWLVIR